MRDSSGAALRVLGTMQEIPAAVVTERRMRRQQAALLALVSEQRDDNRSLDDVLARVTAPTLLIVGGRDTEVLRLNRVAQQRLGGESRLEIVPGAGHLFEEPGALDRVAALARDWFVAHLVS